MRKLLPLLALVLAIPSFASQRNDFRMEVLVDGAPRPEYSARGITYIEALKGREYEILLSNPYGVRVAVALSVDGLNTIDARHTDARSARKWVLEPYQTITLRGWQTSNQQARRFFFTNEQNSYGNWLGKTQDLGNISAVFFKERVAIVYRQPIQRDSAREVPRDARAQNAPGAPQSENRAMESQGGMKANADDYAATGIGRPEDHSVTTVHMNLEDSPAAVVTMRYEYRPALISLGIFPQPQPVADPLNRRERSRGFTDIGYCPTPK